MGAKSSSTETLLFVRTGGQNYLELPGLTVKVKTSDGREHCRTLGLSPLVVGAHPQCDLVIADAGVSQRHCQLARTRNGILVRDLGSKNGTFAGEVRITEAVVVPGCTLVLGAAKLKVAAQGERQRVPLSSSTHFGGAVGASAPMRAVFALLERAAPTDQSILLLGESGTGKEVIAQAIHDHSARKAGPFVVFDCASVAPALIEAQLFGHVAGAFTGATQERLGVLQQAHGGTLFLDELGELPLELQTRLLRALEARQVCPVGASIFRPADARVVAATNRDLREQMARGQFRPDLYYRLAVVEVHLPPLRERKEDIPLLVSHMLAEHQPPLSLDALPPNALELLQAHHWPGNVRELKNTISRLVLFPQLGTQAIDLSRRGDPITRLPLREARDLAIAEFERTYLKQSLAEHGGNVSAAARAMGVSRQLVHRLLVRYGLRSGHDD